MTTQGDEDAEAWRRETASVEPLNSKQTKSQPGRSQRSRHSAQQNPDQFGDCGESPSRLRRRVETNPMIDNTPSAGPVEYARSGLQKKTVQHLKQGRFRYDAKLDLHGHTQAESGEILEKFVSDSIKSGCRCVLIIHGKGRHSSGTAVLKTFTINWLKEIDAVLAFCNALQSEGGTGALYVLLKKRSRTQRIYP